MVKTVNFIMCILPPQKNLNIKTKNLKINYASIPPHLSVRMVDEVNEDEDGDQLSCPKGFATKTKSKPAGKAKHFMQQVLNK